MNKLQEKRKVISEINRHRLANVIYTFTNQLNKFKVMLPDVHLHSIAKRFRHVKTKLRFFNVSFNSEEFIFSNHWAKFLRTAPWRFLHKKADEIYIFCSPIAMIKIKIVEYCSSFRREEITVDFFSMQAEKLTWSLRVKILWSTGEFFSCLFDLQNICGM